MGKKYKAVNEDNEILGIFDTLKEAQEFRADPLQDCLVCRIVPISEKKKGIKDIASVTIGARRWFHRGPGNTYHSCCVTVIFKDGTMEHLNAPFSYGYGQQWDQTAVSLFQERFRIKNPYLESGCHKYFYLTQFCRERKIPCISSVTDVARKRDL